ncbi:MAG: hypothetical protein IJ737_07535 [Ruminococcus sp.]|nr:hypothetical protein [Ruminococcus sp.]
MKKILARSAAFVLAMSTMLSAASCGKDDDSSSSKKADATTTTTSAASTEAPAELAAADTTEAPAETGAADTTEAPADDNGGEATGERVTEENFDKSIIPGYEEGATETVIVPEDEVSDAWASCFTNNDFIDARTLERDRDLHMVVEFAYTDRFNDMIAEGVTDQHKTQIVIGPAKANGWQKFGLTDDFEGINGKDNFICDYPWFIDYEGDGGEWVQANGEDLCSPDTASNKSKTEQVWPDVFVKGDGFVKIGNHDVTSIEYTIPAETVNALIDNAFATPADEDDTEHGWDGILFQIGGSMYITKITLDEGNVFMYNEVEAVYNPEAAE